MQNTRKVGRPPNNRLGYGVQPTILWNDAQILAAAGRTEGQPVPPGTSRHAQAVRALFQKHGIEAPTPWAAIQWVRRGNIPDRWRATVVYLLMLDKLLVSGSLFRRAPPPATSAGPSASGASE